MNYSISISCGGAPVIHVQIDQFRMQYSYSYHKIKHLLDSKIFSEQCHIDQYHSAGFPQKSRKMVHDYSMTFPGPNPYFQPQTSSTDCVNIWFVGSNISTGWLILHIWCTYTDAKTSPEKFQWFFNDISRHKSRKFPWQLWKSQKWNNLVPHVIVHYPVTYHTSTIECFKKISQKKSSHSIWWKVCP